MKLVYIHGANASSESFNFIRDHVTGYDEILIDYNTETSFHKNLDQMETLLKGETDPFFIIAHSLGGIYALHLYQKFSSRVKGAVTMSTPYGGIKIADLAKYFMPFNQLLRDVGATSQPIMDAAKVKIPSNIKWTQLVTTKGNVPWINEPNDCVVAISSMESRKDFEQIHMDRNHYEVVISYDTIDLIKSKIALVK